MLAAIFSFPLVLLRSSIAFSRDIPRLVSALIDSAGQEELLAYGFELVEADGVVLLDWVISTTLKESCVCGEFVLAEESKGTSLDYQGIFAQVN